MYLRQKEFLVTYSILESWKNKKKTDSSIQERNTKNKKLLEATKSDKNILTFPKKKFLVSRKVII